MYKKLFSNPILVRELLESFVKEEFIRELDFDTLQRLDKSFVTDTFRQKESDLIPRLRSATGKGFHCDKKKRKT